MNVLPRTTPRTLVAAAVAVAVIGAALPWWNSHLGNGLASTWLPGSCHVSWDGYSYCDLGSVGIASTTTTVGPVSGLVGPTRGWLALAALVILTAWRRESATMARLGVLIAALTLFIGGANATAGRMVTVAALGLVALALHRRGLLLVTNPVRKKVHIR